MVPKIARLEPDGHFAHFAFHQLSEFYADFGAYDVTIDTPDSMIVGATGRLEGEVRTPGRIERHYVQEDVHDFAFTAWDGFRELTGKSDDGKVALRCLYPRAPSATPRWRWTRCASASPTSAKRSARTPMERSPSSTRPRAPTRRAGWSTRR